MRLSTDPFLLPRSLVNLSLLEMRTDDWLFEGAIKNKIKKLFTT